MLSPLKFVKYLFQPNEAKQYTKSTKKLNVGRRGWFKNFLFESYEEFFRKP